MLHQLTVLCDQSHAEEFGDLMLDAGVLSVTLEDADADSTDEQPLYGEPGLEPQTLAWRRSRLTLLVDEDFDAVTAIALAARSLSIEIPPLLSDSAVPNEDWVRLTQAQFGPTRVSERLWIVPTWHEPPNKDAINIRLDPGVAFGTGSHPTTHLCLRWLDAHCPKGASVLDYGCGTGILAIAAAKLGAGLVVGTDIDPQAVESAQFNAKENQVEAQFCLPKGLPERTFDVVVANILSSPLKLLAPALLGRIAKGGDLVLSGVLARQAQEVIAVYRQADSTVDIDVWQEKDGWVCIHGHRPL